MIRLCFPNFNDKFRDWMQGSDGEIYSSVPDNAGNPDKIHDWMLWDKNESFQEISDSAIGIVYDPKTFEYRVIVSVTDWLLSPDIEIPVEEMIVFAGRGWRYVPRMGSVA